MLPCRTMILDQNTTAYRQRCALGKQVLVDGFGGLAAFGDRPHHQRLAAAHVARSEDAFDRSHVFLVRRHVASVVQLQSELLDHPRVHWPEEAESQQDEVSFNGELGAWNRSERRRRTNANCVQLLDAALLVAGEADAADAPIADAALFVAALGAQLHRPHRPWRRSCAGVGWLGHDLELVDTLRALAQAGSQTIGAGVATTEDDDMFTLRQNFERRIEHIAFAAAILLWQKLHGEVDAPQFATRNREVAWTLGAARQQDGVVFVGQRLYGYIDADVRVGDEGDALGAHLLQAAIDDLLLQLEIGNPVAQQAADAIILFVYGDRVSGTP